MNPLRRTHWLRTRLAENVFVDVYMEGEIDQDGIGRLIDVLAKIREGWEAASDREEEGT